MQNFAYLVEDEKSREALEIDSGWETEPIVKLAASEGMRVKLVCATHGHFDHVKTIDKLAQELGARTASYESSLFGSDVKLKDGEVIRLGKESFKVVYTPGHTEDSVCYYDGKNLFTGDTLFID